ncbi:MAG: hypothetical protein JRD93_04410 [Deltaproteobacteria bacterium]|nr:hypothetical protein [Deltaproteobacteria bacterium]
MKRWGEFLAQRGCSEEEIEDYKKDVNDITIQTGPHLGGFNETISVPELIQCIGAVSAYCIGSRYLRGKEMNVERRTSNVEF